MYITIDRQKDITTFTQDGMFRAEVEGGGWRLLVAEAAAATSNAINTSGDNALTLLVTAAAEQAIARVSTYSESVITDL